jgi:hypothetical protein
MVKIMSEVKYKPHTVGGALPKNEETPYDYHAEMLRYYENLNKASQIVVADMRRNGKELQKEEDDAIKSGRAIDVLGL